MKKIIDKNNQKLLIVQRVLTPYRYELLEKLSPYFKSITILSSNGEKSGAAKSVNISSHSDNVIVKWLSSIKLSYSGESRSCSFFIYPQSVFKLKEMDILLLEGTTNLINNIYLILIAQLLRKKVVWWDAGYSPPVRSLRRKNIDRFVSMFIRLTDKQIAYSSTAQKYMQKYMGANNCSLVLNTISTTYFSQIKQEVIDSIQAHQFDVKKIKLLYVGAIEKRKKVLELIALVNDLNNTTQEYSLTIIGDGDYLETCKGFVESNKIDKVKFAGRIYNKEDLKPYYFNSDLFVMPGDGGLAIAQSLLFGLPCVCTAADGTELDYIDDKQYILNSFSELEFFLKNFSKKYNRSSVLDAIERLQDKYFILSMVKALEF